MATVRIPTPLRPYAGGSEYITVAGQTVGEALSDLVRQHPELGTHLYSEGRLRSFVNVFLGEEDIRHLEGTQTPITPDARLLIIPSIAGGKNMTETVIRRVDHSALRTNQAFIITLLLAAFLTNWWPLVAFVSTVMIVGTIWPGAGLFKRIYQHILRPLGWVKPDILADNPEPHLFAQGLGAALTLGSASALALGVAVIGWTLAWLMIVLAALNLFLGFCAGCFVYYRLNRLHVPGFDMAPVKRETDS